MISVEHFLGAYLIGWLFLWGLSMGGLALVMIHHLTGGAWGLVLRRIFEAEMRALPVVALLFIPVGLGAQHLFPWAGSPGTTVGEMPRFAAVYFQPEFVWARAAAYFAVWILLAWLLGYWSARKDVTGDVRLARKSNSLSGPGLVLYGVTIHFAAIDWMMSIGWPFTSTIFGPIVAAGQLLSALSYALVWLSFNSRPLEGEKILSGKVLLDLGNLLFTLVVVWTYLVWCQFMLIWIGDLRRDNVWLLARHGAGWQTVAGLLAIFQFAVPFFLLLFRAVKRNLRMLGSIAALILVMQLVFMNYQIVPLLADQSASVLVIVVLTTVALLAIWLTCTFWLLKRRPMLPLCDRNRQHAEHLWHVEQAEAAREEAIAHG